MAIDIVDLFKKALKDERKVLRPHFFRADSADYVELVNEEVYLRLRLSRMYLKDRRVLFQTKYPVVNAAMRFAGQDGRVEFQFVARPDLAGTTGTSRLDEVVTLDQTVLGPVLYRGGDLELMLGLYAAPADDWAKRFITLAEGVSKLTLNVPLSTAVTMVGAIKKSLEDSFAGDGLDLKLGLDMELKENVTLSPGYLVMVGAEDKDIPWSALRMDNGELMAGDNVYADHDYMIMAIEVTRSRSDWQTLGYSGAWKKLLGVAVQADDIEQVKAAYLTFNGIIQSSEDLSLSDRNAIIDMAQKRIKDIREKRASTDFLNDVKSIEELEADVAVEAILNMDTALPEGGVPGLSAAELLRTDWLE